MNSELKIKIFADGADKDTIVELNKKPLIKGFTTNPTLMRKAGITDYRAFALSVLEEVKEKPISFEVFSDEWAEMENQAREIATWGPNVYVKIPITNTKAESAAPLIKTLAKAGVRQNVTALMTVEQVRETAKALADGPEAIVSVFAGRIADSGRDPLPIMTESMKVLKATPHLELLWASPREVLNLVQANDIGCHIITMTQDLIKKIDSFGKDLTQFSLETVKMFYNDAKAAGYEIAYEKSYR